MPRRPRFLTTEEIVRRDQVRAWTRSSFSYVNSVHRANHEVDARAKSLQTIKQVQTQRAKRRKPTLPVVKFLERNDDERD